MCFDVLNPNIVVSCPNLTACLRNSATFDFLHSGELDAASCTRHHPGVQGNYCPKSSTYWGLEGTHVAHVFYTSNATNPPEGRDPHMPICWSNGGRSAVQSVLNQTRIGKKNPTCQRHGGVAGPGPCMRPPPPPRVLKDSGAGSATNKRL